MRCIHLGVALFMGAAFVVGCPSDNGAGKQLSVTLASGNAKASGSTVVYEVRVEGSPATISAFGLDVSYDSALLKYSGTWSPGELTEDFTQVGANEIAPGSVRVGGFTIGDPVPVAASGVLVNIEFEVVSYAPSELPIQSQVDDLKAFASTTQ